MGDTTIEYLERMPRKPYERKEEMAEFGLGAPIQWRSRCACDGAGAKQYGSITEIKYTTDLCIPLYSCSDVLAQRFLKFMSDAMQRDGGKKHDR